MREVKGLSADSCILRVRRGGSLYQVEELVPGPGGTEEGAREG